ncbi:MAG: hypothetical protein BWY32_03136 [bacterium ADurb.Bin243]|nr:MAG: hypothetical protein BWY32_03136 [bacterium ADurb.Bin243]
MSVSSTFAFIFISDISERVIILVPAVMEDIPEVMMPPSSTHFWVTTPEIGARTVVSLSCSRAS